MRVSTTDGEPPPDDGREPTARASEDADGSARRPVGGEGGARRRGTLAASVLEVVGRETAGDTSESRDRRLLRDVRLSVALQDHPVDVQQAVTRIVAAYDADVDARRAPADAAAPPDDAWSAERRRALRRVLDDLETTVSVRDARARDDRARERRGARLASTVAVGAGLVGVVVGVTVAAVAEPPGWALAGLGVAVLATATAVAMSTRATRDAGTGPWLRATVLALPVVVLLGSLAVLVVPSGRRDVGTAGVPVLATAAVVVSAAVALASSRRTPASAAWVPTPLDLVGLRGGPGVGLAPSTTEAVGAELGRLARRIGDEADRQAAVARNWLVAFVTVGGAAALTSGGAAVTASQGDAGSEWIVVLAVVGSGLGALATALNPGGRWEASRTTALTCRGLAQELEIVLRLDLLSLAPERGRAMVEDVAARFDAILGVPEHTRLWHPTTPVPSRADDATDGR